MSALGIGIAALFLGFIIGWNAALYVVWSHQRRREETLRRIFKEKDRN